MNVCWLCGVPSQLPFAAGRVTVVAPPPAVGESTPPDRTKSRFEVTGGPDGDADGETDGDADGETDGEADGDAEGGPLGSGVGLTIPPPAFPPLHVNAPVVAVRPAGTASVTPLEKVTVIADPLMFAAW